jgi:hypothetical protein
MFYDVVAWDSRVGRALLWVGTEFTDEDNADDDGSGKRPRVVAGHPEEA